MIDIRSESCFPNLAFLDGGNDYWQQIALQLRRRAVSQQEKRGPRTLITSQVARGPTILLHDRAQLVGILFARLSNSVNERVTRFVVCHIVLQALLLLCGKFD